MDKRCQSHTRELECEACTMVIMTLEVGKTQSLEALTSWFLVLYWWDSLAKSLAWQFGEKNRSCTVSCTSVKNYHHLIEWRVLSWTRNSVWRAMNFDWLLLQSKQFKVKNHEFWVVYIADTFPNCYRFCNDVRLQKVTDRGANFLRSWLETKNFESEWAARLTDLSNLFMPFSPETFWQDENTTRVPHF